MTDREYTSQIITILCYAANHAEAWRKALRKDAAMRDAMRAYDIDPLSNVVRENLIIEFARVFAGVLEVQ